MNIRRHARFLLVASLLAITALYVYRRGEFERIPARPVLASLPMNLGEWKAKELEIDEDSLRILGPGDYLARRFAAGRHASIDLFVAYFASQRSGNTIHSPKNCMPGSGWLPTEATKTEIDVPGYMTVHANRYILAKGSERLLVFYWYQAHGRTIASEYSAKIRLVLDAARLNRTDGALVRISTPVDNEEGIEQAEDRIRQFTRQTLPQLDAYIPR